MYHSIVKSVSPGLSWKTRAICGRRHSTTTKSAGAESFHHSTINFATNDCPQKKTQSFTLFLQTPNPLQYKHNYYLLPTKEKTQIRPAKSKLKTCAELQHPQQNRKRYPSLPRASVRYDSGLPPRRYSTNRFLAMIRKLSGIAEGTIEQ